MESLDLPYASELVAGKAGGICSVQKKISLCQQFPFCDLPYYFQAKGSAQL